jgi:hypothetical protein
MIAIVFCAQTGTLLAGESGTPAAPDREGWDLEGM